MRYPLLVVAIFVGTRLAIAQVSPSPDLGATIQAQAEQMVGYLRSMQYGKAVDMMYPKLIEAAGGRDAAADIAKSMVDDSFQHGMVINSIEVGQAGKPVKGGDQWFVQVPQTVRMTGNKSKIEQDGYILAVSSDDQKTWSFISPGSMTPQMQRSLFPNLPTSLQAEASPAPRIIPAASAP